MLQGMGEKISILRLTDIKSKEYNFFSINNKIKHIAKKIHLSFCISIAIGFRHR